MTQPIDFDAGPVVVPGSIVIDPPADIVTAIAQSAPYDVPVTLANGSVVGTATVNTDGTIDGTIPDGPLLRMGINGAAVAFTGFIISTDGLVLDHSVVTP